MCIRDRFEVDPDLLEDIQPGQPPVEYRGNLQQNKMQKLMNSKRKNIVR